MRTVPSSVIPAACKICCSLLAKAFLTTLTSSISFVKKPCGSSTGSATDAGASSGVGADADVGKASDADATVLTAAAGSISTGVASSPAKAERSERGLNVIANDSPTAAKTTGSEELRDVSSRSKLDEPFFFSHDPLDSVSLPELLSVNLSHADESFERQETDIGFTHLRCPLPLTALYVRSPNPSTNPIPPKANPLPPQL
mmetsp:Transcript_20870/g.84994  ORF Transcript_20870/g.84994 Transcript_20870/m.84994 type:complete len:201 (-) Transcript_20870:244-846(-)